MDMSDVLQLYEAFNDEVDRLVKSEKLKGDKGEKGEMGPQGPVGPQGPMGREGPRGKDGAKGADGKIGEDGKDGRDGADGVGISDVDLDFDNHLRVTLTDGQVIDAGEIDLGNMLENSTVINNIGNFGSTGTSNLFIQDTQPTASGKYLWVDTSGTDISFWVEDGS